MLRPCEGCFCVPQNLLNQDVSHRFNLLVAIISPDYSVVDTRVEVIRVSSGAKPDPGVAAVTIILIVTNDSLERLVSVPIALNPSLLQLGCKEARDPMSFFHVSRPRSVFTICDQWIQGSGLMVDDNRLELRTDLHSKTDLVKRCVPISR